MKLVTANRLADGAVVWLTAVRAWSPLAAEAVLLEAAEADAALTEAVAQFRVVVGAYLIEADPHAGVTQRERLREAIRAKGPTAGHSLEAA